MIESNHTDNCGNRGSEVNPVQSDRQAADRSANMPDKKPGWRELGVAAAAAVVLYAIGIAIFRSLPDDRPTLTGMIELAVSGLAPIGAFAAAVLFRIRDVRPFGLRRVAPKWLLIAVGAGIVVILLSLVLSILVVSLAGGQGVQSDYRAAASGGAAGLVATLFLGALLTPFGEELLFRGVLANVLGKYGPWVAILGGAAIFALAHGINYVAPIAFVVGVVNVILLRRSGAIWPGLIVHVMNNTFSTILPLVLLS